MGWGCTLREGFREKVGSEWRLGGGKGASCTEILDERPPGRRPSSTKKPGQMVITCCVQEERRGQVRKV